MADDKSEPFFVLPQSWNVIAGQKGVKKTTVQIFGTLPDETTVDVKIIMNYTYVVSYKKKFKDKRSRITKSLKNDYGAKNIYYTPLSDRIVTFTVEKRILEKDYSEKWTEVKINPAGNLIAFIERSGIAPYDWIAVDGKIEYIKSQKFKRTNMDREIRISESQIRRIRSSERKKLPKKESIGREVLFWDIETSSADGVTSIQERDHIFMISAIHLEKSGKLNNYVFVLWNDDPKTHRDIVFRVRDLIKSSENEELKKQKLNILYYKTEEKLLFAFLKLIEGKDYQVTYNGDCFDIEYVIARTTVNGLPHPVVGKILDISGVKRVNVQGPMNSAWVYTYKMPGCNSIDLLMHYKRIYPHFHNFKLNTIAYSFLEEEKAPSSYQEMWEDEKTHNNARIHEHIYYAFKDSFLLYLLWQTGVEKDLRLICNRIGFDMDTILRGTAQKLSERFNYMLDPATSLLNINIGKYPDILLKKERFMKDVAMYEYGKFVLNYVKKNDKREHSINRVIVSRMMNLPAQTINDIYSSSIVSKEDKKHYLKALKKISKMDCFICIDKNVVYFDQSEYEKMEEDGLVDPDLFGYRDAIKSAIMVGDNNGMIFIDEGGELQIRGSGKKIVANHKYMKIVQKRFLLVLSSMYKFEPVEVKKDIRKYFFPKIDEANNSNFVCTINIKHPKMYKRDSIMKTVGQKYLKKDPSFRIDEKRRVRYLHVIREDSRGVYHLDVEITDENGNLPENVKIDKDSYIVEYCDTLLEYLREIEISGFSLNKWIYKYMKETQESLNDKILSSRAKAGDSDDSDLDISGLSDISDLSSDAESSDSGEEVEPEFLSDVESEVILDKEEKQERREKELEEEELEKEIEEEEMEAFLDDPEIGQMMGNIEERPKFEELMNPEIKDEYAVEYSGTGATDIVVDGNTDTNADYRYTANDPKKKKKSKK